MEITFKINDVRREAERLNRMGYLFVRWENDAKPVDRFRVERGIVIGFAVDAEERDCFLFRMRVPNTAGKQFVVRCIPARQIKFLSTTRERAVDVLN